MRQLQNLPGKDRCSITDPLRSHIEIHKPTQERDLLNTFQIPTTTFVRFMLSVEDSYRENPYHNSFHAADVTQVWPKNGIEAIMLMRMCPFPLFQSTHVLLNSPNLEV